MPGELTKAAIAAQPEWLARVPTDLRFPDGARVLHTGCGTSFHAAMTAGEAVQALELVLAPDRDADVLVLVSHEGETPMTLEAARAWRGPKWLVTGKPDGPIAELCDEVIVCTPAVEESWWRTCRGCRPPSKIRSRRSVSPPARTSASSSPARAATSRPRTRRC
ncbi:MAG: hypothetical protein E6F98_06785 [Actinobacteria bacterium]|nr:MAG: hypothetical protein E6F98_06785 [Actinomycetota bacterium]